jgi:drug/metabolite transporter (DMT)-like permease
MGALQASAVTYLPPVVALLIGWLREPLQPLNLVAMGAILGGVYAIQIRGSTSPSRTRSLIKEAP